MQLVEGIMHERAQVLGRYPEMKATVSAKPIIVWEPMEDSCRPDMLPLFSQALQSVDVFSPNEHELGLLFSDTDSGNNKGPLQESKVLQCCAELLRSGFGDKAGTVVVRLGADGCIVASGERSLKIPAYHPVPGMDGSASSNRIKDVTGGGNTFLGGFCKGFLAKQEGKTDLHSFNESEIGAIYGSVAAGLAIEQIGVPKMTYREGDGKELWNGELIADRLQNMLSRDLRHLQYP